MTKRQSGVTFMRHTTNDTGRLWVRLISKQALRQYMEFRGMTIASLAKAVGCSHSSIAFLRSTGKSARDTVGPETARRIEEALNAPPGSLFAATVLAGSQSVNTAA